MHDKKAREEYERTLEELIRDYRTSEMLRSGGRRFRPKATPGCCPKPRIADGACACRWQAMRHGGDVSEWTGGCRGGLKSCPEQPTFDVVARVQVYEPLSHPRQLDAELQRLRDIPPGCECTSLYGSTVCPVHTGHR